MARQRDLLGPIVIATGVTAVWALIAYGVSLLGMQPTALLIGALWGSIYYAERKGIRH